MLNITTIETKNKLVGTKPWGVSCMVVYTSALGSRENFTVN